MTGGPAIAVEGLVKRYGARTVVDGVSLEVGPGELVALLGPNGAGKTTTVETVEGYRAPDGGHVRVLGEDPIAGGRALRARVGLMLQAGGFDTLESQDGTRDKVVNCGGGGGQALHDASDPVAGCKKLKASKRKRKGR